MLSAPRTTRLFFDALSPFYLWLTTNALWRASLREMARHFPPSAGDLRLLDVGCGPGNSALGLRDVRPDLRIIGLDFSAAALKMAYRAGSQLDQADRPHWAQADILHLPLPDSSVDAIIGHSVFYMLADRPAFLREALRVLRPGGRLILLDPAARRFPFEMLGQFYQPRIALSVMLWQGAARLHQRLTLESMAAQLTDSGFARILTERAVRGYGVLSRGEKPYVQLSTIERINQVAQRSEAAVIELIDAANLPERGRFIFLLVRQTPDKPAWAITSGESIRWEAALIDAEDRPALLAFSSLPKAVQFMQIAVTSGALVGINKVAKFDKAAAPHWGVDLLLNPPFEMIRDSGRYRLTELRLVVDPQSAVASEE